MDEQTVWLLILSVLTGLVFPGLIALVRRINGAVEKLGACATAASVGEVSQRLATVEAKLEAIDVMEEIGTVHRRVDQVVTNTASVAGELKSVVRSLDTITSHLLDRDK